MLGEQKMGGNPQGNRIKQKGREKTETGKGRMGRKTKGRSTF